MPNVMSRVTAPTYSEGAAPAHPRSEGTVNPALRIFKVPPTDISINAYRMVTIQPTTTGINPMEFIIPGLDDFVDLGRSYFTMELSLKKEDAGNLDAAEKLWPVNNLAHSIIKQIDMQLNGTLISPQSDTYHYKAYLETLLNYDREDGKTVLGPQGWFNQVDFPPHGLPTTPTKQETMQPGKLSLPITKRPMKPWSLKWPSMLEVPPTVWCLPPTWKCFIPANC